MTDSRYLRLANIELTPESPEYEGGTWHVEGQLNEHICATALYYYDNENIMPSQLAFRQQSDTDEASEMVRYPKTTSKFEIIAGDTDLCSASTTLKVSTTG